MSGGPRTAVPRATPALLVAAHGTRDPAGLAAVEGVVAGVRLARPDLPVRLGYLDVATPTVPDVLAATSGPVVVVPLLLAAGYHVRVDLPALVAACPEAALAAPLGPDPLLVDVLTRRLREAGALPGDAVVLGAAGSSDPRAVREVEAVAALLARRREAPVVAGFASTARPTVAEAVHRRRQAGPGRVAVATYLLAPGFFSRVLGDAGADLVTAPLAGDPALAQLVLDRYDTAVAAPVFPRPAPGIGGSEDEEDAVSEQTPEAGNTDVGEESLHDMGGAIGPASIRGSSAPASQGGAEDDAAPREGYAVPVAPTTGRDEEQPNVAGAAEGGDVGPAVVAGAPSNYLAMDEADTVGRGADGDAAAREAARREQGV